MEGLKLGFSALSMKKESQSEFDEKMDFQGFLKKNLVLQFCRAHETKMWVDETIGDAAIIHHNL